MRFQLVLVCVALCLAITLASRERSRSSCRSVCSLTNQTDSTSVTARCRRKYECSSDSLDFMVGDDKFSASFCVRAKMPMDKDDAINLVLRRACRVVNETSGEEMTGRCRRRQSCSLESVTVEEDGDNFTASYCQYDDQVTNWMDLFNGRRGSSSDESSDDDSRRKRRDAEGVTRGPCNITDAAGMEVETSACPYDGECTVGPIVADDNGTSINILFCKNPGSSSESSDSSDSSSDSSSNSQSSSQSSSSSKSSSQSSSSSSEESVDSIARRMFCNACSLSQDGTELPVTAMCAEGEECSAGPVSTDIGGTQVSAKFCTSGADFSLMQALQCRRRRND